MNNTRSLSNSIVVVLALILLSGLAMISTKLVAPLTALSAELEVASISSAEQATDDDFLMLNLTRSSHAIPKHGELEVTQVRNACQNGGQLGTFQKEFYKKGTHYKRTLNLCEVGPYFGLWILDLIQGYDDEDELTAFLRRDANGQLVTDLEEVLKYISECGYTEVVPLP